MKDSPMPDFFDLSFFDRTKFACDPIVTRQDMDPADLHQHVLTFTKIGILDGPNEEANFKYFAGRPDFEDIRESLFGDAFLQIPQAPPLHWDVQKLIEKGVFNQKFVNGRLTWHISPFYLIGLRKVRYDQGTKKFFRDGDTSC